MMKRVSWFVGGAVAGLSGARYAKRKVKQTAAHLAPSNIAHKTAAGIRSRVTHVTDAFKDGGVAKRSKEAELRARRDGRISTLADSLDADDEVLIDGHPVDAGQVIVLHQYRDQNGDRGGVKRAKVARRHRRGA